LRDAKCSSLHGTCEAHTYRHDAHCRSKLHRRTVTPSGGQCRHKAKRDAKHLGKSGTHTAVPAESCSRTLSSLPASMHYTSTLTSKMGWDPARAHSCSLHTRTLRQTQKQARCLHIVPRTHARAQTERWNAHTHICIAAEYACSTVCTACKHTQTRRHRTVRRHMTPITWHILPPRSTPWALVLFWLMLFSLTLLLSMLPRGVRCSRLRASRVPRVRTACSNTASLSGVNQITLRRRRVACRCTHGQTRPLLLR